MAERLGGGGDNVEGMWDRLSPEKRAEHLKNWKRQLAEIQAEFIARSEEPGKNIDRLHRQIDELMLRLIRLIEGLQKEGGKEVSNTEFGGQSRAQVIVSMLKGLVGNLKQLQQKQATDYETMQEKLDAVQEVIDLLSEETPVG